MYAERGHSRPGLAQALGRRAILLGVDLDETNQTISIERQLHGLDNCKSEKIGIKFRRDNLRKISNPETGIIPPIE